MPMTCSTFVDHALKWVVLLGVYLLSVNDKYTLKPPPGSIDPVETTQGDVSTLEGALTFARQGTKLVSDPPSITRAAFNNSHSLHWKRYTRPSGTYCVLLFTCRQSVEVLPQNGSLSAAPMFRCHQPLPFWGIAAGLWLSRSPELSPLSYSPIHSNC